MIENREQFLKKYMSIEDRIKRKNYLKTRKYMANNQAYRLFHASKARAKKMGLEFSLDLEDIIIPKHCPYLGCVITNTYGAGRVATNASIDRKDNTRGYTKDNIEIVSDLANRMKQNATVEELLAFAKGVMQLYG